MRWACTFHNTMQSLGGAAAAPASPSPLPGGDSAGGQTGTGQGNERIPPQVIRLRIARASRRDMGVVMDMIRGLAVFEKEPEAVVTTEDIMLRDGFGPGRQFYVVLAEVPQGVADKLQAGTWTAEDAQTAPCATTPVSCGLPVPGYTPLAFAFAHGAYSTWEGRVLYLEDLYVQPWARRGGLSSVMLTTVIRAAHVAQCARVQWAALDWNTPAIDAYMHPRIGAVPLTDWTAYRLYRKDIERVSGLEVAFEGRAT